MRTLANHNPARPVTAPSARGFSLVEVLIAVLVLAVGLLGLASIFPVVISQQRDATDVIRGGAAAQAIRDQIRSNPAIARELMSQDAMPDPGESGLANDGDGEPVFGWHFQFNPNNTPTANETRYNPLTGYTYLWEGEWNWSSNVDFPESNREAISIQQDIGDIRQRYLDTGDMWYRDPAERELLNIDPNEPDLPMMARLYPSPNSAGTTGRDGPEYVWDFVPRRTPSGAVQLAVFVRSIDRGIRVPSGSSLSAQLAQADTFAVAEDEITGFPTRDGEGKYSVPVTAEAVLIPSQDYPSSGDYRSDPNRPLIDGIRVTRDDALNTRPTIRDARQLRALAQVGQVFVDNLGVVRTVVEVLRVDDDTADLRVRPAFALNVLQPGYAQAVGNAQGYAEHEAARAGKLRQIVFVPQKPIDVFTMEFNK